MPSTREIAPHVTNPVTTGSAPALPGRALLTESRRLLLICLGSGLVYSGIANATHGGPASNGSGGTIEVQLDLQPSPVIYLVIGLIYFVAIQSVLSRATNEAHAARILRRAGRVVMITAAASAVIALVWFFSVPLEGWPHPVTWIAPFLFGTQSVVTAR